MQQKPLQNGVFDAWRNCVFTLREGSGRLWGAAVELRGGALRAVRALRVSDCTRLQARGSAAPVWFASGDTPNNSVGKKLNNHLKGFLTELLKVAYAKMGELEHEGALSGVARGLRLFSSSQEKGLDVSGWLNDELEPFRKAMAAVEDDANASFTPLNELEATIKQISCTYDPVALGLATPSTPTAPQDVSSHAISTGSP